MRKIDPVVEFKSVGNRKWRRAVCRIIKLRPIGGDAISYDDGDEEEDVEWDEGDEGLAGYDCSEVVSHVTLDVFFEALDAAGFKPRPNTMNPEHHSAICPTHGGNRLTLLFREGADGLVEFKCQRSDGCTKGEILEVLAPYILTAQEGTTPPAPIRDPSAPEPKSDWGRLDTRYVYQDEEGRGLFRVDRRVLSDGDKTFIQYHPRLDAWGELDDWVVGVPASVRRVPFRLPQVLAAVKAGWVIVIVEGEKDVLNLERLGVVATTCPGGAGKGWSAEYNKHFVGAHVVILPDNDDAGRRHAQDVAQHLSPVAASVRIVELPGLPAKGDASDWIAAGGTLGQLLGLVATCVAPAPPAAPVLASEPAAPKPRKYGGMHVLSAAELRLMNIPEPKLIIPGYIVEGVTLLVGKPKIGKSWLALQIALAIASGGTFFDVKILQGMRVLYMALEDTDRRMRKRVAKLQQQADWPAIFDFTTECRRAGEGLAEDIALYKKDYPDLGIVFVDILAHVKGAGRPKAGVYDSDTEAMRTLAKIVQAHPGLALVTVHHSNKRTNVEDVQDLVSGSTGLTGGVDTIMVLQRGRTEEDGVLDINGRDFDRDERLAVRFNEDATWTLLGDADQVKFNQQRQEVLATVEKCGSEGATIQKVAEELGISRNTAKLRLYRMTKDNQLRQVGDSYFVTISSSPPSSES